jgi:hypothetical protein
MGKNSVGRNLQQRDAQLEGDGKEQSKNKYATPHLVEYGTLAKLTRGGSDVGPEGGTMSACL